MRANKAAAISHSRLIGLVNNTLPNRVLRSFDRIEGGVSNLNYLLRFEGPEAPIVLRFYTRDPSACRKEIRILQSASRVLPVPEIVASNPAGEEDIPPYVMYRFAEGITFQELRSRGNLDDLAEAASRVWSGQSPSSDAHRPRGGFVSQEQGLVRIESRLRSASSCGELSFRKTSNGLSGLRFHGSNSAWLCSWAGQPEGTSRGSPLLSGQSPCNLTICWCASLV